MRLEGLCGGAHRLVAGEKDEGSRSALIREVRDPFFQRGLVTGIAWLRHFLTR